MYSMNKNMKFLAFLVFMVAIVLSNYQVFTSKTLPDRTQRSYAHSPSDLQHLAHIEKELFLIIKEYIAKLDYRPEYSFQRYIADYEESSLLASNDQNGIKTDSAIHTNPLWSYRMIWRFVTDLPRIKDVLFFNGDSETLKRFQTITRPPFIWPTEKDWNFSKDSLLDLHFVYDLNLIEFANGIIVNVGTNASLAAIHCFDIAQYALKNKQYTQALEWLEVADIKRANISGHPILDYLDVTVVSKLLEDIIQEHDTAWNDTNKSFQLELYMHKMSSKYAWVTQKSVAQRRYTAKGEATLDPSSNDITAFSALCKGGNLQTEKEKSELYCWYESKINPAWYINPQKMELLSNDPYIFQVYDFIGDDLINYLKKEAAPAMGRAEVLCKDSNSRPKSKYRMGDYSKIRTSMVAWLVESIHELRLPILSQRIGYLTGLTSSWALTDALQIGIYATGGQFGLHLDPYENGEGGSAGNRLATFMLYLNNVELGGNTVFTFAGVSVPPLKGSAVFWYTLKNNGETDYRGRHGGCPVLLGEKWVGNKWIHSNYNIFKRKCTLDKDE